MDSAACGIAWQSSDPATGKRPFPSQSVIGEIKLASTVRTKPLRTARQEESRGRVQTWLRKSVQFPSQSVIGEIKLASTRRSKVLLTARPAESPCRVSDPATGKRPFPSQSVIGEINMA